MAFALLALGSNLGDRAGTLRRALGSIARLPATRLVARSRFHETAPIGGPGDQGPFLNGAALVRTSLTPADFLRQLHDIEAKLGRRRAEHWAARTVDLDVLLYDEAIIATGDLRIPHPRMAYRRFVLEPVAEIAGAMVHPESGWTIAALLSHLNHADEHVAVAGPFEEVAGQLIGDLSQRLKLPLEVEAAEYGGRPGVISWSSTLSSPSRGRPKLLLAVSSGGVDSVTTRRMLHVPETGPIAWISDDPARLLDEAVAAVQSVWPALAK